MKIKTVYINTRYKKSYKAKKYAKELKAFWKGQRRKQHAKYNKAKQYLRGFSQANIKKPTLAEQHLAIILNKIDIWYKMQACYTRKGHSYICDFVLEHPYYIVFEVDGEYHNTIKQMAYDAKRDYYIGLSGYCTKRFKNQTVIENPKRVHKEIIEILKERKGLNKHCRFKKVFFGGVSRVIKRPKPIDALQSGSISEDNQFA